MSLTLHEARAGVVGLVADDAIEFGRVRDDLVDRERQVRRRQDEIHDAGRDRLGGRDLDGFVDDLIDARLHAIDLDQFPAARAAGNAEVARLRVTSPRLAVTVKLGVVLKISCSM